MTAREIPVEALVGDVVEYSAKHSGMTDIVMRSGRWLTLIDAPDGHSATAWQWVVPDNAH